VALCPVEILYELAAQVRELGEASLAEELDLVFNAVGCHVGDVASVDHYEGSHEREETSEADVFVRIPGGASLETLYDSDIGRSVYEAVRVGEQHDANDARGHQPSEEDPLHLEGFTIPLFVCFAVDVPELVLGHNSAQVESYGSQ